MAFESAYRNREVREAPGRSAIYGRLAGELSTAPTIPNSRRVNYWVVVR